MPEKVQIMIVIMSALSFSSIVWALVHFKIKKELETRGGDTELGPVVDVLREDVELLADVQEHTRAQLSEMQERLDFAERMLAAGPASQEDKSG